MNATVLFEFAVIALLVGCFTSWVVVFLGKIKVLEYWQIHGGKLLSELAGCHFCLNWWIAWVVVLPIVLLTGEARLLLVPFVSTTIGRFLSA